MIDAHRYTKSIDRLERTILLRATNLVRTLQAGHSTKRALAALVRSVRARDKADES